MLSDDHKLKSAT